jgi:hypothetical protein
MTELQRNLGSAAAYARLVVEGMADEYLLRRRKPSGRRATRHPRTRRKRCEYGCMLSTSACPQAARSADHGPRTFKRG